MTTVMGLWLWREVQATWPMDSSGPALEVKSRYSRANPRILEERLPVGQGLVSVCARAKHRARGGWASVCDGKFLLAGAQHGGCTTASWVGTTYLEVIPPPPLCGGDPPG